MAFDLTPWRPFRELSTLRDEMDRIFDRFFGEWPSLEPFRNGWTPSVDVSETQDNIVVKGEMPGMDPKDIQISLSDGLLTIKGEKKQEEEEKDENYHLLERRYGSFSRMIRLPHDVQADKVKASYKNGVLKVILPKSEEAKKKEVKIRVE